MKQVRFWTGVRELLRSLEADDRRRIGYALHVFAITGTGDVNRLTDREGQLRLRVGDWRVRIQQVDDETIDVLSVRRRDKTYKAELISCWHSIPRVVARRAKVARVIEALVYASKRQSRAAGVTFSPERLQERANPLP